MNFLTAFEALREPLGVTEGMRLPQWGPDVIIRLQVPDEHSKMSHPYLYVESRYGRVPWMPTVVELFSVEWELVY